MGCMATTGSALLWTPDFQIGVPELDRQHQFLCELINRFSAAVDAREDTTRQLRVLQSIMEFLRLHDETEERLMRTVGFASLREHAREHKEMLEYLKRQYERMLRQEKDAARRLRDTLVTWCGKHIGGADQEMSLLCHLHRRDPDGTAAPGRRYAKLDLLPVGESSRWEVPAPTPG